MFSIEISTIGEVFQVTETRILAEIDIAKFNTACPAFAAPTTLGIIQKLDEWRKANGNAVPIIFTHMGVTSYLHSADSAVTADGNVCSFNIKTDFFSLMSPRDKAIAMAKSNQERKLRATNGYKPMAE